MSHQQSRPQRGSRTLLPAGWPQPKGYANGIRARGELIFVAGQVGWDSKGQFADGFVAQAHRALENIVAVLAEANAQPRHVVRLTWYVTDMATYRGSLAALGKIYRDAFGHHYPTMTLVEVKSLAEPAALVEIEATAVLPE